MDVRPGRGDFGVAERRPVHVVAPGLGRRAHADHRLAADQGRAGGFGLRGDDRRVDRLGVVAVDIAHDVPAVSLEALGRVVGEPAADVPVDRDPVVVAETGQLAQAEGAGERADLVADPLHQAAVAEKDPGVVIDDLVPGPVEAARQDQLGDRHPDRVGQPLPERAGRGLDPRGNADFRVTRGLRVQLAKRLEILDRQVVPGQVQQRVEQHRAVAVREHEAVAVGPRGVGRVVAQVVVPENLGDLGHPHRHAGVAGVGLLDRIHRQCANGAREVRERRFFEVAECHHCSKASCAPVTSWSVTPGDPDSPGPQREESAADSSGCQVCRHL